MRFLICFLFLPVLGLAQRGLPNPNFGNQPSNTPAPRPGESILDDSTKQIYGIFSTKYYTIKDFVENDTIGANPDTVIVGFEKMDPVRKSNWAFQDLGNEGTSSRSFLPPLPSEIYSQTGFNRFLLYAPFIDSVKFYNTRSPFTNFFYQQNNNGLLKAGFTHSQNIHPRWNFALDANRITSSKQISATTSEDRLVDHWDYTFNTNYTSKNNKYTLLAALVHFNHKQNEQGGMDLATSFHLEESELEAAYNTFYSERLSNAFSRERWNDVHVFQQFYLGSGLQVYNKTSYLRHLNLFTDPRFSNNFDSLLINPLNISTDTLAWKYVFQAVQNDFGFKGNWKGFNYLASFRPRFYRNISTNGLAGAQQNVELSANVHLSYLFPDSTSKLDGDIVFGNTGYIINASLKWRDFKFEFHNSLSPVPLFYRSFSSETLNWENNFNAPFSTRFRAYYNLRLNNWLLSPYFNYDVLGNFLYVNHEFQTTQANAVLNSLDVGLNLQFSNKRITLAYSGLWNENSAKEILSRPTWTHNVHAEIRFVYAKILKIHLGSDIHYKSSFQALAFSPYLQQFFVQNQNEVWGQPVADVYLAFRVQNVRASIGFTHVNQGFPTNGFYTTPGYLALGRSLNIKVNWPLFD